jgi:hypothetical protein
MTSWIKCSANEKEWVVIDIIFSTYIFIPQIIEKSVDFAFHLSDNNIAEMKRFPASILFLLFTCLAMGLSPRENAPQSVSHAQTLNIIVTSNKAQDGWVLESKETSNTGGGKDNSSAVIRVGDDLNDRQYRSILSFDTSAIHDNAVILSAVIKVRLQSITGRNPFQTHGLLRLDIQTEGFSKNLSLQLSDFGALPAMSSVGSFNKTASAGGWYGATINSASFNLINPKGVTQFRMRFAKDDNDDRGNDYLAFYSGNSASMPTLSVTYSLSLPPGDVIAPEQIEYAGAFRLPNGGARPLTFEYGGNAMTFNSNGDPSGSSDGFPGSLFISGHDRMPYGELPNGGQIAEVNIPIPTISGSVAGLNQAGFLQEFKNAAAGHFTRMDEIPRMGLLYLDHPSTGPKIHIACGQHFEPDPPAPTHGWFDPNLSAPDFRGEWYIGTQSFYSVNDYMLEVPSSWADTYAQGRYVGTGRFRDGGWSGMGPALFAYRPWVDSSGTPAPSGSHLDETVLLLYENSFNTANIVQSLAGYQHPDGWEGGAWLADASGKSALLFAGTKSNGVKYWYGYVNPASPNLPCVDQDITDFVTCRMADGSSCPQQDFTECAGHNDYRGWWTTRFDAQFILYNPADLARVATGELEPWQPQPYAVIDIDEHLFMNPSGVEQDMLGTGSQRRYRIGSVAYDRQNSLLYVLELFADEAARVVHVWQVR